MRNIRRTRSTRWLGSGSHGDGRAVRDPGVPTAAAPQTHDYAGLTADTPLHPDSSSQDNLHP